MILDSQNRKLQNSLMICAILCGKCQKDYIKFGTQFLIKLLPLQVMTSTGSAQPSSIEQPSFIDALESLTKDFGETDFLNLPGKYGLMGIRHF